MALTETPICHFGQKIIPFSLIDTNKKARSLTDLKGPKGTVIVFICNHCPYVQAILPRLIEDSVTLKKMGVNLIAINANDAHQYPADSFEKMQEIAEKMHFPFPYLWDEAQGVASQYGAVCTPDFFGYNAADELQYRGRLDASKLSSAPKDSPRELVEAMTLIAQTGRGPNKQIPSMGCSIKWKNDVRE